VCVSYQRHAKHRQLGSQPSGPLIKNLSFLSAKACLSLHDDDDDDVVVENDDDDDNDEDKSGSAGVKVLKRCNHCIVTKNGDERQSLRLRWSLSLNLEEAGEPLTSPFKLSLSLSYCSLSHSLSFTFVSYET